ncbi:uncharacterized protein LOC107644325 isoform X2 [Arachis ipaensis]|uniref:uncharacterized protein LOC107644325 isoform X2 n=1 Tax=Arachis ipaensis TaxID=130454 RepID=UPI0007AF5ECA|nr:uncharacterized protein LOC107644325 isoform X2 [Arachis ipaensis]XP_025655983.1 uncharacterized protein LOC112751145 isoform X2 [Arachis hypogaea]
MTLVAAMWIGGPVEEGTTEEGHGPMAEGRLNSVMALKLDAAAGCRTQIGTCAGLGAGRGDSLELSGGGGAAGRAVEGGEDVGPGQVGRDQEDGSSESQCFEDQRLEKKLTWDLAIESGAMLFNEEDDIMVILQAQNEEIARKRKVAKQKAKMRRCRPKSTKQSL